MFRIRIINEQYKVAEDQEVWQKLWSDEVFGELERKTPDPKRRQYGYATTEKPFLQEVEVLDMRVDSLDIPSVIQAILQAAQATGKPTAEEAP